MVLVSGSQEQGDVLEQARHVLPKLWRKVGSSGYGRSICHCSGGAVVSKACRL